MEIRLDALCIMHHSCRAESNCTWIFYCFFNFYTSYKWKIRANIYTTKSWFGLKLMSNRHEVRNKYMRQNQQITFFSLARPSHDWIFLLFYQQKKNGNKKDQRIWFQWIQFSTTYVYIFYNSNKRLEID